MTILFSRFISTHLHLIVFVLFVCAMHTDRNPAMLVVVNTIQGWFV